MAGLVGVVAGAVLGLFMLGGGLASAWWSVLMVVLLLGGGFGVYEGWAGWCALRAMGFKTRV